MMAKVVLCSDVVEGDGGDGEEVVLRVEGDGEDVVLRVKGMVRR